MKIAIIGDGGWGTANAVLLAGYGHQVTVWSYDAAYADEVRRTRENAKFLKGVKIPESIAWTADPAEAVAGAEVVVLAPPSQFFVSVCARFVGLVPADGLVVTLTKGIDEKTHKRMSVLAKETLGVRRVVALSGPTHAEEVSRGIPTTIVAAAEDEADARLVQSVWNGPVFRVYTSNDLAGVELGGTVKNVIAIAVGGSDGLGFGDNTRAALITRGVAELARFVKAFGGDPRTVSGLSGIGDLIVTCTSRHSRNHSVGERLGRGEKIEDILGSMQMVAEGVWNARVVHELALEKGVEMPIAEIVYRVCHEGMPAREALATLMNRPAKGE